MGGTRAAVVLAVWIAALAVGPIAWSTLQVNRVELPCEQLLRYQANGAGRRPHGGDPAGSSVLGTSRLLVSVVSVLHSEGRQAVHESNVKAAVDVIRDACGAVSASLDCRTTSRTLFIGRNISSVPGSSAAIQKLHKQIDWREGGPIPRVGEQLVSVLLVPIENASAPAAFTVEDLGLLMFGPLSDPTALDVQGTVLSYFRKLLGLSVTASEISHAEAQALAESALHAHLVTASAGARVACRLAADLPHLQIPPHVHVHMDSMLTALHSAQNEQLPVSERVAFARAAQSASLQLSTDPAMTPRLFFPWDHLATVFAPLLIPLILPVFVFGLKEVVTWLRRGH